MATRSPSCRPRAARHRMSGWTASSSAPRREDRCSGSTRGTASGARAAMRQYPVCAMSLSLILIVVVDGGNEAIPDYNNSGSGGAEEGRRLQRQMENEAADEAVPLAYARALIRQVQRQGCDPGPVLERAGLGSEALLEEQRGLSAEAYSRLWRAVRQQLGDESGGRLPGLAGRPGT